MSLVQSFLYPGPVRPLSTPQSLITSLYRVPTDVFLRPGGFLQKKSCKKPDVSGNISLGRPENREPKRIHSNAPQFTEPA
jgi:hypothetical protein